MNRMLPTAISSDFVTQVVGDEIIIYNLLTNKALSLNPSLTLIWNHCDGKSTFQQAIVDFKHKFNQQVDEDYIELALDELSKAGLIKNELTFLNNHKTRREVIFRYGMMAVALPVISAIIAPTAANAQSREICLGTPVGDPCPADPTMRVCLDVVRDCPAPSPGINVICSSCCCMEQPI